MSEVYKEITIDGVEYILTPKNNRLEDIKQKFNTGNYICINQDCVDFTWEIGTVDWRGNWDSYKLIHKRHQNILTAFLNNSKTPIKVAIMSVDSPREWKNEPNFIDSYDENNEYELAKETTKMYQYAYVDRDGMLLSTTYFYEDNVSFTKGVSRTPKWYKRLDYTEIEVEIKN